MKNKLTILFALLCVSVMGWAYDIAPNTSFWGDHNFQWQEISGVTPPANVVNVQPHESFDCLYVTFTNDLFNKSFISGCTAYTDAGAQAWLQLASFTAQYTDVYFYEQGSTTEIRWGLRIYNPAGTPASSCASNHLPVVSGVTAASNITYNSAQVTITASDEDGEALTYVVKNGDTQIASSSNSTITLSGLTPGTTYSALKAYAVDACGTSEDNANNTIASFTTESRSSECEGDLGHFATFGIKRIHYKIEYLASTNKIRYEVRGYDTQVLDFCQIQTSAGNSDNLPIVDGVAVWKQDAPAAGTEMGILFLYSTDAIGGNEMNAENTTSFTGNNAHLVYYKSRDCAADPEPASAPTTTPNESTIFNDCQIYSILGSNYYLSAGFNDETNAWGGGTATTETIDGRQVLHIANSNYLERGFVPHDVSGYTHIHFDVWTQEAMSLGIKLMAYEDGWKEGVSQYFTTNVGTWKSIDLPLSGFNHNFLSKIQGIYPSQMQQQDVYFTNIYFYKTTDDVSCYETLNLAEGKPSEAGYPDPTASGTNQNETAKAANDGSTSTKWVTYANQPASVEWWYVDLKNNYGINKVEIVWDTEHENYSTEFILQTRTEAPSNADKANDASWVDMTTDHITNTSTAAQTINVTDVTGRYVRFHSLARNGDCIRLAELRVFGTGYAVTDTNDPVITTAAVADDSENYTSVKLRLVATDVEDVTVTSFLLNKGDGNWLPIVTDASNCYTVSELARGHYSYQVKARDHAGNVSAISTINFDIFNPADNLALNKDVVAGYTNPNNAGEVPAKANDGNLGTPWTTFNDQPMDVQWWSVDLGEVYQLSGIDLFWDVRSNHYLIQVAQTEPSDRTDDSQWFTALEVNETQTTGNAEANKNHYALNVPARYVRFKAITKEGTFLKLWEFRVFGTGFASLDVNNPVITTAEVASDSENETSVKLHLVATDVEEGAVHTFLLNKGDGNWQQITTDANDFYTVSDLERGHYSYQVKAIDPAVHVSAISTINFTIFNSADNLALNKDVVAGYTPGNAAEVPTKANDGNLESPWTTYNGRPMDEQWWSVDLGAVYQLANVDLFWGVRSNHYLIQIAHSEPADRSDDTQWYTILEVNEAQKTGTTEDDKNRYAVNATARYIRFKALSLNDDSFLKLWELRAFGSAFATADNNAPTITAASVSYGAGKAYLTLEASDTEDGTIKLFRVVNTTTGDKKLLTADGENKIAIEGLEINTQYEYEIQAMDKAANLSAVRALSVRLPVTAGNLAKDKPVVAGFETGGVEESKEKVNDGDASSYWATWNTGDITKEWIYVDLQGVYELNAVVVKFGDALVPGDYILQTRREEPTSAEAANDAAWDDLDEVTTATVNASITSDASGVVARYVRFRTKTASVRVCEIEVYANTAIVALSETDNAAILAANDEATVKVELPRTFPQTGEWYTLCLPFDMSEAQMTATFGAGYTLATLTGAEDRGSLIHLNFDYVRALQAGKPYLLRPGTAVTIAPTISAVTIQNIEPIEVGDAIMKFKGTFGQITLNSANQRFVGPENYLYSPAVGGTEMDAFRCYFTIPSGSPALTAGKQARIVFGTQTATGVENIQTSEYSVQKFMENGQLFIIRDGRIYNAQGVLVK